MSVVNHHTVRWLALTALTALMLVAVGQQSTGDMGAQLAATVGLAVGSVLLLCWIALDRRWDALTFGQVLITLLVSRVLALTAQPLLEDDHFRYLWDGFVTATTGRPFQFAPSHFFAETHLPLVMSETLSGINNPDVPTIYGPLLQMLFALCYWIAPATLWPFKVMLLLAETVMLLLLRAAGVSPRWLLALLLHPLLLKESAVTAHPDLLIGVTLLAAVIAWQHARQGLAAGLACAAVAIKVSALIALPLFMFDRKGRFSVRGLLVTITTLCVLYGPMWLAGSGDEGRAIAVFGQQWTFNPLLFKIVAVTLGDGDARRVVIVAFVVVWGLIVGHWIARLRASCRALHRHYDGQPPLPPIIAVTVALLLLSPTLNPWYWLWLMPLATLRFSLVTWAAAGVALLAYAHVWTQVAVASAMLTYAVPWWSAVLQMGVIAVALAMAWSVHRRSSKARRMSLSGYKHVW